MPYYPPSSGGTPGGSNTQVQYNNSGAFDGVSFVTIDNISTPKNLVNTGTYKLTSDGNNGFLFDNSALSGSRNNWNLKCGSDGTFIFDQGGGLTGRLKLGGAGAGTFWDVTPDFSNSYFKVQDNKTISTFNNVLDDGSGSAVFGGTVRLATGLPAVTTATIGGYFNGLGIGGVSSSGNHPIFGVLNSAQGGSGLGATAFTVTDTNVVTTFNSTLDDGSGNTTLGGNLTLPLTKKLNVTTGTNASAGTGTLSSGTATIATSAVTSSSLIFLQDTAASLTNVGVLSVSSKTAGTSFTVTSANVLDSSTFNWLIIN